jgi:AraC-like DNA-binding protein
MISRTEHQRLCRARQQLQETGMPTQPLAGIAAEAGLSRFQFIRRFAAVFGETPHQYRQRHRLEVARELLLLGNEPVTEICLSVGFSSLGSFSSLFKRHYGVAPSRYRARADASGRRGHQPGCLTLMQHAWPRPTAIFEKHRRG